MLLRVLSGYEALSHEAARIVAAQVQAKPDGVLCLPTGGSPKGMFAALCTLHARGLVDFSRVTTFNLDEWVGLAGTDPRSFRAYMDQHFFGPAGLSPRQIHFLDGLAPDLDAEARRYDQAIEDAGGIDLIILGVGVNGHIAFNEPSDTFSRGTNVIEIAASTIPSAVPDFGSREAVPPRAITIGVGTILRSRKIVLLASGAGKSAALHAGLAGPVHPRCPASALQLHPDVELLIDPAAFSLIEPALPLTGVTVRRETDA